jgi:hypothetical protein
MKYLSEVALLSGWHKTEREVDVFDLRSETSEWSENCLVATRKLKTKRKGNFCSKLWLNIIYNSLELIVAWVVEELSALYGTQNFITVFIRAATGPYPEPVEFSSRTFTLFL